MLSNACFLAKFRFDETEKEPAKICKILQNQLLILPILQAYPSEQQGVRAASSSQRGARPSDAESREDLLVEPRGTANHTCETVM